MNAHHQQVKLTKLPQTSDGKATRMAHIAQNVKCPHPIRFLSLLARYYSTFTKLTYNANATKAEECHEAIM